MNTIIKIFMLVIKDIYFDRLYFKNISYFNRNLLYIINLIIFIF